VLVGVGAYLNRCNSWRRSANLAHDLLLFLLGFVDMQLLNLAGFLVWELVGLVRSLLGDFRFGLGLAWNLRMLVLANVDRLVKGLKLL